MVLLIHVLSEGNSRDYHIIIHARTHIQFSGHSRRVIAASENITAGNVSHNNQGTCMLIVIQTYDFDFLSLSLSLLQMKMIHPQQKDKNSSQHII